MRLSLRRHRPRPRASGADAHQLTRDVLEAEEIAVAWLRSRGFSGAHRVGARLPMGVRAAGVRAYVSFDPLPVELEVLQDIVADAGKDELPVSFTFAGWSPEAQAWADQRGVPLVRFTFAGTTDPSNDAARRLSAS